MSNTYLGFDFGLKYIGVAVGQDITGSASPLTVLLVRHSKIPWHDIDVLFEKWDVCAFVLGLSLQLDGSKQTFHPQLVGFRNGLLKRYKVPVHWTDECYTTREAKSRLLETVGRKALTKENIDATSAQIILQQWFDENDVSS